MIIKELITVVLLQLLCLFMGLFIGYYHGLIYGLKNKEEKIKVQSKKTWWLKPIWKLADRIDQKTEELKKNNIR